MNSTKDKFARELMASKKYTSHLFHFVMTIIFFPWALVWILCHARTKEHNDVVDRTLASMYDYNGDTEGCDCGTTKIK